MLGQCRTTVQTTPLDHRPNKGPAHRAHRANNQRPFNIKPAFEGDHETHPSKWTV